MQDVLPEAVRQQHSLGSWLDDLEEAHSPTTLKRYERACRGLAMRVSQQLAVAVSEPAVGSYCIWSCHQAESAAGSYCI
jgi:hypothetical protein